MSTNHTRGPLVVAYTHEGGTDIAIDDEPGMQGERNYDLFTVTHGDPDELQANARRLVACWNACDGIDTDLLEGFSPRFLATSPDRHLSERRALEAQRDYLLTALESIVKITDGSQPIDYPGALMVARAAIAQATRSAT